MKKRDRYFEFLDSLEVCGLAIISEVRYLCDLELLFAQRYYSIDRDVVVFVIAERTYCVCGTDIAALGSHIHRLIAAVKYETYLKLRAVARGAEQNRPKVKKGDYF